MYAVGADGQLWRRHYLNGTLQPWSSMGNGAAKFTNRTAYFVYDGDGNRVLKTEGGETTVYVNQYYEKNLTTSVVTTHYYLGDREIAYRTNGSRKWVAQDHLGSTVVTLDSSGNSAARLSYYPFGGTRTVSGGLNTDELFTGQRLDDTGLYFYNARYYDANIGRFISADTLVQDPYDPQSLNRYSYVLNNPLKYTDPSGHLIDILFDIGSAIWDVVDIVKNPTDPWAWGSLGADVVCAFIPFVAGGGAAVRGVKLGTKAINAIDNAADTAKGIAKGVNAVDSIADTGNTVRKVEKAGDTYAGVREASKYLKNNGFDRAMRKKALGSFDPRTVKLRTAGSSQFGLRYYDNKLAGPKGHCLFETLPASRESLAIRSEWNQMTSIRQWQIRPGATYLEGAAARQGLYYPGGQTQMYVLNLVDLL
jgi:RHS repeat-associated protein